MSRNQTSLARRFECAEEGSIAIIFALTALVLVMVTGLAIDVGRVMHANNKITASLDSAALAAAKGLRDQGLSDREVKALAKSFFSSNMDGTGGNYAVVKDFRVNIDRRLNAVTVEVDADVPMLFAGVAGLTKIALPRSAVAAFEKQDIEVALQLDVTGSMKGSRIRDLKAAVDDLLNILLPDGGSPNRTRIALAPYASGVNAGSYAKAVSGGRAGADGCVYERRFDSDQASEAYPSGDLALKARSDFKGGVGSCPDDAEIVPLSDDRKMLSRTVNSWSTSSSTAGHLGTAWAWYLLSPEWAPLWPNESRPVPYGQGRTKKFTLLMTDGMYNTYGGVMGHETQSNDAAVASCEAMRRQGVIVYTIGFQAPGAAKATLRRCASSADRFYDAANGEQLRAAFRAIAVEIGSLRLTQ